MAQSCNPGVIQIAQKLGAEKFYKYQKEFGFGQKTGIDLPGEAEGILHAESQLPSPLSWQQAPSGSPSTAPLSRWQLPFLR